MDWLTWSVVRFPVTTAATTVCLSQAVSSALSFFLPQIVSLEWLDVYSLAVSAFLSSLYYVHSAQTPRQTLMWICTLLWSIRLGGFLAGRILSGFHDKRLDSFRQSSTGSKKWWFAQTIWISMTFLPVWIGMSATSKQEGWGMFDFIGFSSYAIGFVCETVADMQKSAYMKREKHNPKRVACNVGLFKCSRFPNYFGEWLLWTGLSIVAWEAGDGWIRILLPSCSWFVLSIFYRLSIPLAIKAVRKRATEKQFQEWCQISLFVPMPPTS